MGQEIVVGLIVVLAASYVVWRYLPAPLKSKLGRVHPALAEPAGCGACSSCGTCATGSDSKNATEASKVVAPPASRKSSSAVEAG